MADEELEPNTAEQKAYHKAQEAAWAEQRVWPMWQVVVTGDEALYEARPGAKVADRDGKVKLEVAGNVVYDEDHLKGDPIPWTAEHRATVTCLARTEQEASMFALRDNPSCHTVESVKKIREGQK